MGLTRSAIIITVVGTLAGVGACSLTIDLDDITGGQASVGGAGGQGGVGGGGVEPCSVPSDCPPPSGPCDAPICLGGECGMVAHPSGTPLPSSEQVAGDCLEQVCSGSGEQIAQNDDGDFLAETACAAHACNSGIPTTDNVQLGTECGTDMTCDGEGSCVECFVASDCTALPEDDECQQRTCDAGVCGQIFTPEGTEVALQTEGNCLVTVCDGAGGMRDDPLNSDLPDDGNDCTSDSCVNGVPEFTAVDDGTLCGGNQMSCQTGHCTGCNDNPANCPGQDTFCRQRTCVNDTCDFAYVADGEPLPDQDQTPQDCQRDECDGQGNIVTVAYDPDLPPDDGNQCTEPACVNGSAQFPPLPLDSACSANGVYCDGNGSCVDCNSPQQCPLEPDCRDAVCASNQCDMVPSSSGTPSDVQQIGDCQVRLCDGAGGVFSEAQDSDRPNDFNPCTNDVCTNGVPSNPPSAAGTFCSQGGVVCDGAGNCVDCVNELQCLPNEYCSGGNVCIPDEPTGTTCARDAHCQSGFCVDGVCCDTACDTKCVACVSSKTGQANGTCAYVIEFTDPNGDCIDPSVCQFGGCCDPNPGTLPQSLPSGDAPNIQPCISEHP